MISFSENKTKKPKSTRAQLQAKPSTGLEVPSKKTATLVLPKKTTTLDPPKRSTQVSTPGIDVADHNYSSCRASMITIDDKESKRNVSKCKTHDVAIDGSSSG